jgi:hypothetical protein
VTLVANAAGARHRVPAAAELPPEVAGQRIDNVPEVHFVQDDQMSL